MLSAKDIRSTTHKRSTRPVFQGGRGGLKPGRPSCIQQYHSLPPSPPPPPPPPRTLSTPSGTVTTTASASNTCSFPGEDEQMEDTRTPGKLGS
eukprot:757279-Hanusia_phi.AAC.4